MNKHILYIEDNADQQELIRQTLERGLPGVIVDLCCTASGAESFLNRYCYEVVIVDVDLPGELGTDIAAKILERDSTQPIYLMSEFTGPQVREAAAKIGLKLERKFSQKKPSEFVENIKTLLAQRPCDSAPGADTRGTVTRRSNANDVHRGESTEQIQKPAKPIQLTSPYVLAARASLYPYSLKV